MKYTKETRCTKARTFTAARALCIVLMACFLLSTLSACLWFQPLRLPKLREFERNVYSKYPLSIVECRYSYGAWVEINVKRFNFDEECAYTILGYLNSAFEDGEFIKEFYEFYEKAGPGHENPPHIDLNLMVGGKARYRFRTHAEKIDVDPEDGQDVCPWVGYTKWYSNGFEITQEEIKEKHRRRYSGDS